MFQETTTLKIIFDKVVVFIKKIAVTSVAIVLISMFLSILVMAFEAHDISVIALCIVIVGLMTVTLWAVWTPSKHK